MYNQEVERLDFANANEVGIKTTSDAFTASTVLASLPPNLLVNSIDVDAGWPLELTRLAQATHTWMGESIKVGLEVSTQPWLQQEVGMVLSNVGPATELHDHGTTGEGYLLKGFIDSAYSTRDADYRREQVTRQLERLFPGLASKSKSYHEKVWSEDRFTYYPYVSPVAPHQNNGATLFRKEFFDGRLLLIGAETSALSPGYMDGAVARAMEVSELVMANERHRTQL